MKLPVFIAGRYLVAKKSHNVINIISAISAVGMAIGTAALIIILSIYNGFDSLVKSMMSSIEPDLIIEPAKGKTFIPEGPVFDWLYDNPDVLNMSSVLEENVFLSYEGRQSVALVKGVDAVYEEESPLSQCVRSGNWALHRGSIPLASVGTGLAYEMHINPRFLAPIEIYFPSRTRKISLSNPASSIESIDVWPGSTFSVNSDIDKNCMIIPIEKMRELLAYENEVSAIEIRLADATPKKVEKVKAAVAEMVSDNLVVKNRFEQNESLYKMLKSEKMTIYLILFFIIIIIAFNIFGSLSMLIIEKQGDIATLRYMGADDRLIRKIFIYEGWMISLIGMAAGLVIGITIALIQQHFGIIKMPGNFIVEAYPVILSIKDILLTTAGISIIGYLIALFPAMRIEPEETADPNISE